MSYDPITTGYYTKLESFESHVQNAFIAKVYSIVFCQLLCSAGFSVVTYCIKPVQDYVLSHPELMVISFGGLLSCMIYMFCGKLNGVAGPIVLSVFSICQSYILGIMCTAYSPVTLLSALCLTSITTGTLTVYVHVNKHKDFSWTIPLLLTGSTCFMMLILFTWIFGTSDFTNVVLGTFGSLLFSGYLVWDTYYILTRYTPEDYILASLNLYLDIINLFMSFLRLTSRNDI